MARRNKERRRTAEIEETLVNLTPLIDVVFVVLVMFILVAPMLELDSVELADGKDKSQQVISSTDQDFIINVYVRSDNTIWVDKRQVSEEQLGTLLMNMHSRAPQSKIRLFPDKGALFGVYQTVKNSAEAAGFESMDVILKPV